MTQNTLSETAGAAPKPRMVAVESRGEGGVEHQRREDDDRQECEAADPHEDLGAAAVWSTERDKLSFWSKGGVLARL